MSSASLAPLSPETDELYHSLAELAPDGVFLADRQGRLVSVNAAGCALLGSTREELIGKALSDLIRPEDKVRLSHLRHRLAAGEQVREAWTLQRKDGGWLPLELTMALTRAGYWQAIGRDLSPRLREDARLRESEERFRTLADEAALFIWISDPDRTITYANRTMLTFLGVTATELGGERGWPGGVHPDDRATLQAVSARAAEARQPYEVEIRFRQASSGRFRWHLVHGTPRAVSGEFAGFVSTSIDIDARKRAELRDEYLVTLAHAVRPLTEPGVIVKTVARLLVEYLDVDRCAYAEVESDENTFTILGNHTRGLPDIVGRYQLADFGEEALRRHRLGQPFVVADVDAEAPAGDDQTAYRAAGISAVVAVPLHKDGRFVAGLAVHQRVPRTWSAEEIEVVQLTANWCWESIERARVSRDLQASERRLRMALTSARMVSWEVDPVSLKAVVLDNAQEVFGLPSGSQLESTSEGFAMMHPDDAADHQARFMKAIAEGDGYVCQFRILRQDNGAVVWVEERANAVRDESGRTTRLVGVMMDITERRRAEEEAARLLAEVLAQHERTSEVLESISDAFYAVDANFCFTYVNRKAEALWGRRREDLIGRHCWTEFPAAVGSESHRRHLTVMAERRPERYEAISPLLRRWLDVTIYPEAGGGLSCYFRDIENRKQNETRLREQEQRQGFLLALGDSVRHLTDPGAVMATAAGALGRHLGVPRVGYGEIDAAEATIYVDRDWTDGALTSLAGVSRPLNSFGPAIIAELRAGRTLRLDDISADPHAAPYAAGYESIATRSLVVVPLIKAAHLVAVLYLHAPRPRAWSDAEVLLAQDVAERTWAAVESARAQQALRHAHALMGDKAAHLETIVEQRTARLRETIGELEAFSYSIAHDMRAPLRALQGYADILLEDYSNALDAVGQNYLKRIAKSAGRMDELIQDVLSYSRVVSGDLPMEPVDIGQLVRDIAETYPSLAPDKVDVEVVGEFPRVLGNPALFTQVFSNLMGNAAKFVAAGVRPHLRLWAETHHDRVRLFVRDNGIGIPAGQREKIFGMFEQLSTTYEGTGIGLAIVKKAIERMAGTVGVDSTLGQGSTFWVDVRRG